MVDIFYLQAYTITEWCRSIKGIFINGYVRTNRYAE